MRDFLVRFCVFRYTSLERRPHRAPRLLTDGKKRRWQSQVVH